MNKVTNDSEAFSRLLEELAELELRSSDEEIRAEVSAAGLLPSKEVQRIRELIHRSIQSARKHKLLAAEEEYQRELHALASAEFNLPRTAKEQRELLHTCLARCPEINSAVTAQFRDFKELTDADVELALKQLAALGLIRNVNR
jgi:hypothetical protein